MQTLPVPASAAEAVDRVLSGLKYLAITDPATLAAQVQAECLQAFEQADAISTAARARILAAFTAGQGYSADADYSPAAWLIHRTKVTRGAARGHLGWARRSLTHPQVLAALAELRALDDGSVLETQWVTEMQIRWSARRAQAGGGAGGDGGAWLDGDAARAMACDAAIAPIVTGDINPGVLDDLVALCLRLTGHGPRCAPQPQPQPPGSDPSQPGPATQPGPGQSDPATRSDPVSQSDPATRSDPSGPSSGLAVLSGMSRKRA